MGGSKSGFKAFGVSFADRPKAKNAYKQSVTPTEYPHPRTARVVRGLDSSVIFFVTQTVHISWF